jgi:hypothetical protein
LAALRSFFQNIAFGVELEVVKTRIFDRDREFIMSATRLKWRAKANSLQLRPNFSPVRGERLA